jgi:ATP-dependent DNA ligase
MVLDIQPITLYRKSAHNKLQVWIISASGSLITIEWGEEGGVLQTQYENVEEGLGGRTLDEQVISRVDSRISAKIATGYVRERSKAIANKAVNKLGLNKPMLATKYADAKDIDYPTSVMQCKYDGHRCLIHFDGQDYTAYSRRGNLITSISEIMDAVKRSKLQPGQTLDGELYHHGTRLQTITSWVKRRQPATTLLSYVVYDLMTPEEIFYNQRYSLLLNMELSKPIKLAPTDTTNFTEEQVPSMLSASIAAGYEGLILRRDGFPYQDGKRSKSLIKIKAWEDEEFVVIDITQSREGYALLVCKMESGKEFGATAPGTMEEKYEVWERRDEFIGKHVNVQYANLTDEGKPFHPTATGWRDKENE